MKSINIPEPCSENWNEMSPTEKGAFCQKCAIDVYDFTNKSGDEIRDILTLNIGGRVCGRIEPKQLEELNDDFMAWKMSDKQSFNRAWIFTLLAVFGMTLFSCEEDEVPVVQELQKKAQVILSEDTEDDIDSKTVVVESILDGNQIATGQFHIDSKVEAQIETPIEDQPYIQDLVDVQVSGEEILLDEVYIVRESSPREGIQGLFVEIPTRGALASSPDYQDYLIDTTNANSCIKLSGLVYPNPASNQTTLRVTTPKRGKAEIDLFDLNGSKIRTIHSGRVRKGENEYPIDLTALETGMYLVVIVKGGEKSTVKFSKI